MTDDELKQWADAVIGDAGEALEHEYQVARAVLDLLRERDAALAVLRAIEWNGSDEWEPSEPYAQCSSCHVRRCIGHAPDCPLAACLRGGEGKP